MKKNLFYYLFAVVCSVCVFTACSDDDEDTTWQLIPEITNENVTLTLNEKASVGATAELNIMNGESGELTLLNAIYGYPSVKVNVALQKKDATSYDFSGTANLDAAREALSNSALKVTVNGTVDTAGKMTVDVATSGWAAANGVYANDSLSITFDGKAHDHGAQHAVTLKATEEGVATLVFRKINNVALDVEANVALVDGKIEGSVEPLVGYNIAITGVVADSKLTLDLVSSGYGTIKGSYSAASNKITFNGKELTSGSVGIEALEDSKANVTLGGMLSGSRSAVIENVAIEQEEGKEIYSLNGALTNDDYKVTFVGTVGEDGVMTASVTYEAVGAIVGKWNLQKQQNPDGAGFVASTIFNFATTGGTVTFPEEIVNMIPEDMKPMFPTQMPDAQLQATIKGLLATYAVCLQSVEFTKEGKMVATYIDLPKDTNGDGKIDQNDGNDMAPKSFDMLKYYTKEGQLFLTVSLEDLLGMMSMADQSTRAWDGSTILTEGIPFNCNVQSNQLSLSLATDVTIGTVTFANSMLPLIGTIMPDLAETLKPIQTILGAIVNQVFPEVTTLEAGLVFEK